MIKNVIEYFEDTLKRHGNKIAVVDGNRRITFEGLADKIFSIGTALSGLGNAKRKQPIAVFMPKSIECIASDIGIAYSGNAYMNLDVKTPAGRLKNTLASVKPEYVVTTSKYKAMLESFVEAEKILLVEELCQTVGNHEGLLQGLEASIDTDPFCLMNTSGSTGTPKSVVLSHKSFIGLIEWVRSADLWSDNEVIGSLSPAVYYIHTFEMCIMMAKAATVVMINDMFAAFPVKILQLINAEKVSCIVWVPTMMVNIANMGLLDKVALPSLKVVGFGGEVFPTKALNCWRKALPNAVFVNMYASTEISVLCTYCLGKRDIPDNEPIPIGHPRRNMDVLILDENDKPAGKNEGGELCVKGSYLAMGYYNNPEETAAAFVQNPLNHSYPELIFRTGDLVFVNEQGEMVFRGRKDSQIKHSGYRIELSEIEHVIVNALHLVKNGCAAYDCRNKEIVLFYEADEDIDVGAMRKAVARELPQYMLPRRFERMELLPRNANGKIDRLRLKQLADSGE